MDDAKETKEGIFYTCTCGKNISITMANKIKAGYQKDYYNNNEEYRQKRLAQMKKYYNKKKDAKLKAKEEAKKEEEKIS